MDWEKAWLGSKLLVMFVSSVVMLVGCAAAPMTVGALTFIVTSDNLGSPTAELLSIAAAVSVWAACVTGTKKVCQDLKRHLFGE
jgi:hypothetical protein